MKMNRCKIVLNKSFEHHEHNNQNQPAAASAPTAKTIPTIPAVLILAALKPLLVAGGAIQINAEMDFTNQC